LAIAQALLAKAAHVAVGDVDSRRLQEAQHTLRGSNALLLDLDVTSSASIRKAIHACQTHFGGLDTLVNSAGVIRFASLSEITEVAWDKRCSNGRSVRPANSPRRYWLPPQH